MFSRKMHVDTAMFTACKSNKYVVVFRQNQRLWYTSQIRQVGKMTVKFAHVKMKRCCTCGTNLKHCCECAQGCWCECAEFQVSRASSYWRTQSQDGVLFLRYLSPKKIHSLDRSQLNFLLGISSPSLVSFAPVRILGLAPSLSGHSESHFCSIVAPVSPIAFYVILSLSSKVKAQIQCLTKL